MYSKENRASELAKFISSYGHIFIDTCSLMEVSFPTFMDDLSASRHYYEDCHLSILKQCINELKKHASSKDINKKIDAKRALKIIKHDRWHQKIICIEKTNSDSSFADKVLFNLVNELRSQEKILVITQDKKLAYDLRTLNHLGSQHGRIVDVYKIRNDSTLEPNYGENENGIEPSIKRTNIKEEKGHSFFASLFKKKERKNTQAFDAIYNEDKRLSANLFNSTYPVDRKISDIESQIVRLKALSKKDYGTLRLAFSISQLEKEKNNLSIKAGDKKEENSKNSGQTPLNLNKNGSSLSKNDKGNIPFIKKEEKPLEAKKEKNILLSKEDKKDLNSSNYSEFARNASFAFERLGEHYGWLFRDPSIPFMKGIHGDFNLTSLDLAKMDKFASALKMGDKKNINFGSLYIEVIKEQNGFRLSYLENSSCKKMSSKEVIISSKKEEKSPITPKKNLSKSKKQLLGTKPVASLPSSKKVLKEVVPSKTDDKPLNKKVKPLLSKTNKQNPIKKKEGSLTTQELSPSKEITPKKVVLRKKESKPSRVVNENGYDPRTVAVPKGVTLIVATPKEETKISFKDLKNVETNSTKNADSPKKVAPLHRLEKNSTPKKETKRRVLLPSPTFKDAYKGDQLLNANLNNPNYPKANKIRDIEFQIALLRTIKVSEQKKLLLGLRVLEKRLKELKG